MRHNVDTEQVLDILEADENRRHDYGYQRELCDGRIREAGAEHVGEVIVIVFPFPPGFLQLSNGGLSR